MGADIMRIVASSLMFRNEPHGPQIEAIVRMLKESVKIARGHGVVLAIENHIDYTSAEILEILERVGLDALKVNFDTGNTLRMMEDPVAAARRLGPYTVATHTKDVDACRHVRPEEWYFFSSVPVGTGLIDMPGVVRALKDSGYRACWRSSRSSQGPPGRRQAGRPKRRVPEATARASSTAVSTFQDKEHRHGN
jgi:3-oxoisoapionate decarboxylase